MALRPPTFSSGRTASQSGLDVLDYEIAGEMASALGRAGQRVEETLARLRAEAPDSEARPRRLRDAAEAVHAYFIQRELCGMRRHEAVIREYDIPKAVLVRLGAK
jgi:hypothetical protein